MRRQADDHQTKTPARGCRGSSRRRRCSGIVSRKVPANASRSRAGRRSVDRTCSSTPRTRRTPTEEVDPARTTAVGEPSSHRILAARVGSLHRRPSPSRRRAGHATGSSDRGPSVTAAGTDRQGLGRLRRRAPSDCGRCEQPTTRGDASSPAATTATPTREWTRIDWRRHLQQRRAAGGEVNYVEIGEGEPILFIHGISGCWQNWLENLPHFGAGHRAIALDLPGFGASPMPDWEIGMPAYGRLMHDFCEELGLEGATLVGNSMGGFIAVEAVTGGPGASSAWSWSRPPGSSTPGTRRSGRSPRPAAWKQIRRRTSPTAAAAIVSRPAQLASWRSAPFVRYPEPAAARAAGRADRRRAALPRLRRRAARR